jgi:hypothetical protein
MYDELEPGDAITVRSEWGAIATGTIANVTDKPTDALTPGDWLIIIEEPVMWDVSEGGGEYVEIDKGRPLTAKSTDWDGPGVSIGVGTDWYGFELAGEVILRQPEPVYRNQRLRHYTPLPCGPVEEIAFGGLIDRTTLLEETDPTPDGVTND